MIYRILKNKDHYIIQRKRWFGWDYLRYATSYGTYAFCFLRRNIDDSAKICQLALAEEHIRKLIELDQQKIKENSKYEVVKTIDNHESPLYKVINDDK